MGTHGGDEKQAQNNGLKPQGKGPVGNPKGTWEDNETGSQLNSV